MDSIVYCSQDQTNPGLCLFTSWVKVLFHWPLLLSFPSFLPLFPSSLLPGTSPVHTCRQGPWSTLETYFSCVDSCRRPMPTTVRQQTASSPTRTFCGWGQPTRARVWRQSSWRSVRRCWDRRHRAPLCPRWDACVRRWFHFSTTVAFFICLSKQPVFLCIAVKFV